MSKASVGRHQRQDVRGRLLAMIREGSRVNSRLSTEGASPKKKSGTSVQKKASTKSRTNEPEESTSIQLSENASDAKMPKKSVVSMEELLRQKNELDRRAAELEARERELRKSASTIRVNNFPPLPKSCPLKPCFYQNIDLEIPLDYQRTVRLMFYLWFFYAVLLFVNLCGDLALVISRADANPFERSIRSFFLYVPLSYMFWFRSVYNAFRDNSSLNFMLFFFVFSIQVVISAAATLGISKQGIVSVPIALTAFQKGGPGLGFFLTTVAVAQALFTLACLVMLMRVHRLYRATDASVDRATAELTNNVLN